MILSLMTKLMDSSRIILVHTIVDHLARHDTVDIFSKHWKEQSRWKDVRHSLAQETRSRVTMCRHI